MAEEGNVLLVHVKGWIADRPICPPEFLYGKYPERKSQEHKDVLFERDFRVPLRPPLFCVESFMHLIRSKAVNRAPIL